MSLVTVRHCKSVGMDIQLFYDTFGDRTTGQPLLLVMGLGGQMILWRAEFCERLAEEGFFVIRFDNRDVGLSTHLDHLGDSDVVSVFLGSVLGTQESPYTIFDMALDAVALLDNLGLPQAHICGFSMGGLIVQQMAVSFPERVLSLTTVSSPAGLSGGSLRGKMAVLKLSSQDPEKKMKRTVKLVKSVSSRKFFDAEKCEACVREVVARSRYVGGVPRQLAAILATDYGVENLHTVRAPTMVFHGTKDPLVPPESGKVLVSSIPGARLFMLEDVAHDLPPEIDEILISGLKENAGLAPQPFVEQYNEYEPESHPQYDYYAPESDDLSSADVFSVEESSDWSFDTDPLSNSTRSDFSEDYSVSSSDQPVPDPYFAFSGRVISV